MEETLCLIILKGGFNHYVNVGVSDNVVSSPNTPVATALPYRFNIGNTPSTQLVYYGLCMYMYV